MKAVDKILVLSIMAGIVSTIIFETVGGDVVLDWFRALYIMQATNIIYTVATRKE